MITPQRPSRAASRKAADRVPTTVVKSVKPNEAVAILPADLVRIENIGPVRSESGVRQHCWTGEGQSFAFFLRLDRDQPREVTLECLGSASKHNWTNIFLECDGTMQLCSYRQAGSRHLVIGTLPASHGGSSALLRYYLQETRPVVHEQAEFEEAGRVGLCISRVNVAAARTSASQ